MRVAHLRLSNDGTCDTVAPVARWGELYGDKCLYRTLCRAPTPVAPAKSRSRRCGTVILPLLAEWEADYVHQTLTTQSDN